VNVSVPHPKSLAQQLAGVAMALAESFVNQYLTLYPASETDELLVFCRLNCTRTMVSVGGSTVFCRMRRGVVGAAWQTVDVQIPLVQSVAAEQCLPSAHRSPGEQAPPQSTSVSVWFCTESEQDGA
jgi:predicted ArsR family transcriptional regulator